MIEYFVVIMKGGGRVEVFSVIIAVIAASCVLTLFLSYWLSLRRGSSALTDFCLRDGESAGFPENRGRLTRIDAFAMTVITLLYGFTAFYNLGENKAPQSFCHFDDRGRYVLIELREEQEISSVQYYTGLKHGDYYLQFSLDGENWVDQTAMPQSYADLFKWQYAQLLEPFQRVKYVRIISGGDLYLGELALYDGSGSLIPADELIYDLGCAPLFDEQELVPSEGKTQYNSAYFDEIYHARTAYENVENIYPYEISHPPLGKLIISVGIRIFGMTPFGWRFMGTLFGVLMLPLLYLLLKNLFSSTAIASCGTLMFAFDFMHFVQTRIATIDTYAVFFILLSYLFMYRWLTGSGGRAKCSLALCGVSFGVGCACKWTVVYAGAGLALIWLLYWIFRGRDMYGVRRGAQFLRELFANILFCCVFFVLVPVVIYYLSYYPYGKASGLSGVSMYFTREYLDIVINNQKYMFSYHSGLVSTHPYSSHWYQWLFDIRPILYYSQYFSDGEKACFGAFTNPILCWAGLLAVLTMSWQGIFRKDKKALFIFIGYLSQLLPWVLVSRLTFAYHYFPCMVFIVLAVCHVMNTMRRTWRRWRAPVYGFTGSCLALFVLFYPVLAGAKVSVSYIQAFLKWIPGMWPW